MTVTNSLSSTAGNSDRNTNTHTYDEKNSIKNRFSFSFLRIFSTRIFLRLLITSSVNGLETAASNNQRRCRHWARRIAEWKEAIY